MLCNPGRRDGGVALQVVGTGSPSHETVQHLVPRLFIAFGILDVWLLRAGQRTPYRGGPAKNMRQEFAAYGLPMWVMYAVGTSKVAAAVCLIVGEWVPALVRPAAIVMAVLMAGAMAMHIKIGDPPKKNFPATLMLALSTFVAAKPQ